MLKSSFCDIVENLCYIFESHLVVSNEEKNKPEYQNMTKYDVKETIFKECYVPSIKDQGNKGTCGLQSLTSVMEARTAIVKKVNCKRDVPALSIQYLNMHCPFIPDGIGTPDITQVCEWAKHEGVPSEKGFVEGNMTTKWKIKDFNVINNDGRIARVKLSTSLFNEGPFILVFRTVLHDYVMFNYENKDKHIYHTKVDPNQQNNVLSHAIAVVGMGEILEPGTSKIWKRYWICQDSHGVEFGKKGFVRIMEDTFEYAITIGDVSTAIPSESPYLNCPPPKSEYQY